MSKRWILRRGAVGTAVGGWIPVALYFSPAEAAAAVCEGTTGETDWDRSPERLQHQVLLTGWTITNESAFDGRPPVDEVGIRLGSSGSRPES